MANGNGRITNATIYEMLKVLTEQVNIMDKRQTAMHGDMQMVIGQLQEQIGALKKKSLFWNRTYPS